MVRERGVRCGVCVDGGQGKERRDVAEGCGVWSQTAGGCLRRAVIRNVVDYLDELSSFQK